MSADRRALVAFGLGANLERPEDRLREAIAGLASRLEDLRVAPLYRTAPISPVEQNDFLNTAAVAPLPAASSPREMLGLALELEHRTGRRREVRWGPRSLDVDLLLWGDEIVDEPGLTVPHPRLAERRFVLAPLADLAPDLEIPGDDRTVRRALAELGDDQPVERIDWTGSPP